MLSHRASYRLAPGSARVPSEGGWWVAQQQQNHDAPQRTVHTKSHHCAIITVWQIVGNADRGSCSGGAFRSCALDFFPLANCTSEVFVRASPSGRRRRKTPHSMGALRLKLGFGSAGTQRGPEDEPCGISDCWSCKAGSVKVEHH